MSGDAGISVSELNLMVAEAIRRDPRTRSVTVRGEVGGFKHHIASGHWYFSLKDPEAAVNCVMFRCPDGQGRSVAQGELFFVPPDVVVFVPLFALHGGYLRSCFPLGVVYISL